MRHHILTLLIGSIFSVGTHAQEDAAAPKSFYQDSEQGWFWYQQLPQEEKEKFIEKLKTEQPTFVPQPNAEKQPAKAQEKPLSTAWFKVHFEQYKNAAIDNPYDQEAMRTYLYMEKFMRDRATAFAYERQKAVYSDPFLDATSTRPTANFGLRTMDRQASQIRDSLMKTIGEKAGLYFFYRSDCIYCEQQAPLIKMLETDFAFEIKPVSLDGKPMKDPLWESYLTNNGQAEALGVMQVPAIYIFNPAINQFELVSQGIQALPQLKRRIIAASERAELVTPEQAQMIRGSGLYQTTQGDISNGFPIPDSAPQAFQDLYFKSIEQE